MTVDQTANFVRGTVASSIGGADTTISVDNASIYPDPSNGEYNLVLWDFDTYRRPDLDPDVEIVRVTGRDTTNDNLTVIRGEESTSAVSHPSTSELQLAPTSKVFTDIDNKITSNITVTGSNGLNGGSAGLGGSVDISINGSLDLDGDLQATDGETIWDESATYIPQARLENDSMTIAGNSVSLGGSTPINHTNLSNINSDDHHTRYTNSEAITAVEGASFTSLDTSDIVKSGTTHLSFDGSGNVDILNGELSVGPNDHVYLGSGYSLNGSTNTSYIQFTDGDTTPRYTIATENAVGGDLVFYSDRDNIETLRLQYSGKVNIPNGNLALSSGATITDGTNDRINFGHNETSILDESGQKSINVNSSNKLDIRTRGYPIRIEDTTNSQDIAVFSEGGNISIPSGDLTDGANVIYDQSASEIPDSAMGSISNSTLTNSSITVNGGTDISGGSASLGGSLTIDHADTSTQSNVSTSVDAVINGIDLDGRGHVTSINTQNRSLDSWATATDDNLVEFGSNNDFSIQYESSSDELVIRDETNGVDLIRQPKQGSTEFIQGADIGSIEAPKDSLTQLANASATSASASGDIIGYTFAVDNQTGFKISATSDSSGGLSTGPIATLGGDLKSSNGEIIWNDSATEIPDSAMGSISNSTLTNSSITVNGGTDISGGSASLGGSLTIDHADTSTQGNVSAGAGAAITDINLDGRGHTTSISTTDFDSRFVLESGDTMSGTLTMDNSDIHFDNGAVQISRTSTSVGSGALFLEGHNGVTLHSNDTNKDLLNAYDTGNVEIPNGNLEMGSGAIQTSNFEVEENSSTNSLDFNYTG